MREALAAVKSQIRDDDALKAELWEIAENLHRCDLSKEQRDEHIRRYNELLEAREAMLQSCPKGPIESKREDGRGHRPTGNVKKIAETFGLSKKVVRHALTPKPAAEVFPIAARSEQDAVLAQANAIVAA